MHSQKLEGPFFCREFVEKIVNDYKVVFTLRLSAFFIVLSNCLWLFVVGWVIYEESGGRWGREFRRVPSGILWIYDIDLSRSIKAGCRALHDGIRHEKPL